MTLLVVAHEGFRNGATRVLAGLLPLIAEEVGVPVQVRVLTEGPMAAELRAASTAVGPAEPSAVLVNSALAAGVLVELPEALPSLVYVHEEGEALASLPPEAVEGLVARAGRVLCVSERSRAQLERLGVATARIGRVPPVILAEPPEAAAVAAARARAGAETGAALVVGCGEATWRKGTDLFVQLVRAVEGPVRFAWVGRRTRAFAKLLDCDTELTGVGDRLRWVGEVDDAVAFLGAADLFVLTSREDPQPLVPLEAAVAGTATVGFAGTGLDDLAERGAARTVPYPDVAALAAAVADALADEPARDALVAASRTLVARERSWEALAPTLVAEVQALVAGPAPADPRRGPTAP